MSAQPAGASPAPDPYARPEPHPDTWVGAPNTAPDGAPERPREPVWTRAELRSAALVALTLAVLGAPVGLLWAVLSPRVHLVVGANGPDLVDYDTSEFFGGDGTFLLVTGAAGLVTGLVAWALVRPRGPALALGLTVGGLAAAVVAWKLGHQVGLGHYRELLASAPRGARFERPVDVRAYAVLVAWPFAALAVCVGLAARERDG